MGRADLETRSDAVGALADGPAAWLYGGSRMSADVHVRFCERLGVRFPGPTHRVVGFPHRADAARFRRDFQERLARFGLEVHPAKTRLIACGRFAASDREKRGEGKPATFTFLGFTHYCGRNAKGYFVVWRRTAAKRLRAKLFAVKQELRRRIRSRWCGAERG